MDLNLIDFGKDTAEFDNHLSEYFLRTNAYQRAISGDKSIIIGRKGTGKTSILRYCEENESKGTQLILKIEATHATYVKIDESLSGIDSEIKNLDSSFKLGWMFTTLLAILERFFSERTVIISKEETELYNYAKEHLGYDSNDPISAIGGYVLNWMKQIKTIGPVESSYDGKTAIFDETRTMNLIKSVIKRINDKGLTVYLFYDKLDEKWDGSRLYINFLQGLLMAVKDIRATGLNVIPVILLRDDIFKITTREFQHIDHFRMAIEQLKWDELRILELLSLRIKTSMEKTGEIIDNLKDEEILEKIFTESLPNKKNSIKSYTYMVERTLARPRDIILYANMAKEKAINRGRNYIGAEDVLNAEKDYSEFKINDLVAEVSYNYPNIKQVIDQFNKKSIGYEVNALKAFIREIIDNFPNPPIWLNNVDDVVKTLYSIGFLSYTKKGGVLRGTRIIHSGIEDDVNEILEQRRIYVSPIFRKALKLKEH